MAMLTLQMLSGHTGCVSLNMRAHHSGSDGGTLETCTRGTAPLIKGKKYSQYAAAAGASNKDGGVRLYL